MLYYGEQPLRSHFRPAETEPAPHIQGKQKGDKMNWYLTVLKKYAEFSGRARRKEYWMFVLMNFLVGIVIAFIGAIIGETGGLISVSLSGVYSLFIFIPSLAVTVRRLHDTNKSGWWILISLVPLIGGLVLLIFMIMDSDPNTNAYGANPKAAPEPV
ncbi:Inner membrane protein YhaI [Gimesia chilikensis]|uniref:Inner membrane protein YhaI n=2 Tax=Gimesia chilikensis TaxID=2605989 RepID=A0A517PTA2_9PLAN|nr:Inner membrane protein YhaI [Gimesia chilikensis]QDT86522.1 Inner membrane protein YhaI [Gimesia chilikensis]